MTDRKTTGPVVRRTISRPSRLSELGIDDAPDRGLDLRTQNPDIAELTVVQPLKLLDRFPTRPVVGEMARPGLEPSDQSARRGWPRGWCRGRGHRAHGRSPLGSAAKRSRRR